jgi:phosphate transport system permease protein
MSNQHPSPARRKTLLGDRLEKPIESIIRICGWSSIAALAAIFIFILKEAGPQIGSMNWGEFFTSTRWIPNPAEGNQAHYGAFALIVGTFSTTAIALLIAVPLGLAAAVYLSEFASGKLKEVLKIVIELLAAIPSIVWGVIGLTVLGPFIQDLLGAKQPGNLLVGGIVLGLMSVPLIVSLGEDALRAVPDSYREAALALGASKWEIVYRVLFPAAKTGLLAAVMLGLGRAVGETMAALLATGHNNQIPSAITDPVRTITATIAAEMAETVQGDDHYRVLFVLGLFLFLITGTINVIADLVIKGRGARHH